MKVAELQLSRALMIMLKTLFQKAYACEEKLAWYRNRVEIVNVGKKVEGIW